MSSIHATKPHFIVTCQLKGQQEMISELKDKITKLEKEKQER